MALYCYKAIDVTGKSTKGLQDAADAVLCQRTEAALKRVVLQVANAGATSDQIVHVAV